MEGGLQLAFPIIFSIHGETLHNHYHGNQMCAGQMAVNDSGVESALHYASDITRTIPIVIVVLALLSLSASLARAH